MVDRCVGEFVWAPRAVFVDGRLTKIQLRVLLCLFSFYNPKTRAAVYPKRETIARRVGYSVKTVSVATSQLVGLGWVSKVGNGGCNRPCFYQLHVPGGLGGEGVESDGELKGVLGGNGSCCGNGYGGGDEMVTGAGGETVTASVRGIEQSSEQTIEQSGDLLSEPVESEGDQFSLVASEGEVLGVDVGDAVVSLNRVAWERWLAYRRGRRLPKYRSDRLQGKLALLSAADQGACVDYSIEQNYAGLFPERFGGKKSGGGQSRQEVFWGALGEGLE